MFNFFTRKIVDYIFIILTATILFLSSFSESFSDENVFIVDNVKVEGSIDLNFLRENYINKAFLESFKVLITKILLSKDINSLNSIKLNKIRSLINSFQILEEKYQNNIYKATFKIFYNDIKVKKLLREKNISFSQPKDITVLFFPMLFSNNEIINFKDNYFYNEWTDVEIENESINFVLPLEDLDDISKIKEMKNRTEELKADYFVNKYDVKNYVFAIMDYEKTELSIHIKTNFEGNIKNKNISYELSSLNNKTQLKFILKNLKLQILELWKEANIVNLLMPLTIKIKFKHKNLLNLKKIKNDLYNINIIDHYVLEEFNINNSFFKIYYYGNPKRLQTELSSYGYQLRGNQGHWELYLNE